MAEKLDPVIVAAEENALIDFQFKLQELMTEKGLTASELADRAGISKSRMSQIMGPEANPTLKTLARLFCAMGEDVCADVKRRENVEVIDAAKMIAATHQPFNWTEVASIAGERFNDGDLVALVKDTFASNDNQVVVMESELMMTLEAA